MLRIWKYKLTKAAYPVTGRENLPSMVFLTERGSYSSEDPIYGKNLLAEKPAGNAKHRLET
jgi:hypothetical protein